MAAFAPKPKKKLPSPIISKLIEKIIMICPTVHIIHAIA